MKKNIFVTGGSSGIGRAIVEKFAQEGHNVYFTYRKSVDAVTKIKEQFPNTFALFVDFSNTESLVQLLEKLRSLTIPDVIVNNFGINRDALFVDKGLDDFFSVIDQNFKVPVTIIRYFLQDMIARRSGTIINISSVAAHKCKIGNAAYGVSKTALERFSKTLALEVARFAISVNCVAPGFVDTPLLDEFLKTNLIERNQFLKNVPARKIMRPEDVANTVSALTNGMINTIGSVITLGNGENIGM